MRDSLIETLSVPLDTDERQEVISKLNEALATYEDTILLIPAIRLQLFNLYNERARAGKAVSKLSRNFTMNVKGASQALSLRIAKYISNARDLHATSDRESADYLKKVAFAFNILLDLEIDLKEQQRVSELKAEIEALRNRLFVSVVQMASDIARKVSRRQNSEYDDLLNEALIAAFEAVKAYKPVAYPEGEMAAAFTTFVYTWISGSLLNFEADSSRMIRISRSAGSRWWTVKSAIELLGDAASYKEIAETATDILNQRRLKTRGQTINHNEKYTEAEVLMLMLTVQAVSENEIEKEPSDARVDELLDKARMPLQLEALLKEHCTDKEFELISIRWNTDTRRSLEETVAIYEARGHGTVPKSTISSIESRVFAKIRKDPRARDLFSIIVED